MTQRDHLHVLIDRLPADTLPRVLRFVEAVREEPPDPLQVALANAPLDDEPLTAEDERALEESARDIAEGRVVSHEEARKRLLGAA